MRRNYKNIKYPLSICCIITTIFVMLITLGYSSFLSTVTISDINLMFRLQEDIRITNISTSNTSNNAVSNYEEYNVHNINTSVTLPNNNSTITYEIEVVNVGNVKEGIFNINEIYKLGGVNTSSNLEIKNMSVNLKESLCDDNNSSLCKLGSTTTFTITIGYKTNGYNGTDIDYTVELDFDFRRMFDISYTSFNSTSNLPAEIISGDTLNITFNSTTGIPTSVSVTGATGNYTSPTLTLSNVTDNVNITGTFSTYTVITDNTTTTYDHTTLAPNTDTTFNNIAGKPRVVVDGNGKVISFEYTDTGSGISFAEGDSFDTGVDAFDSGGYTIHLKYKMDPYDNTGKMVISAMKKTNGNKYAGFSFNVYSGSRFYLYANTSGANINQTAFGTLLGTFNVPTGEQTYEFDMTYTPTPNKGIVITLSPCTSGSPYAATDNNLAYYPDTLEDASIVLGGSVANHNKDIETMTILEFSVTKN